MFLSVVVRFDAGRGLVDDPTSLGTCFSSWRLVRALYPASVLTRVNLLATFGACVGEVARDAAASDSKLLVTMAGRLHVSGLHGTVDCDMAIWTFICPPFVCPFFATACARCVIFLSLATLCFLASRGFSAFDLDVFFRFAYLRIRIHCHEAAVLRLSKARLRHVFCLRTGALFFSFNLRTGALFFSFRGSKGATSHPCEWAFFASPELGFRWCFAVSHPLPRGRRFAFVQARLRHVFCLRTGALFFSFRGSKGATSHPCEWPFFASPELGFRWCFAVSHPLPRGCRFAFERARLRHVFCLRTGALFFSFRGSKGATSHHCEWPFFASPELGFRWCFAVSHPLPRGCRFAFEQARLRHVFCLRTGALFFSFRGSKGATSHPCDDHFLPRLSSDLGGVLLFRIHCQEVAVLRLSRLGCVTFFVYVLGLFSSPLGAPKVPLRTPANDHFLPRLSSDLGGVLLFRIHCQEVAVLRLSRLGCVTFFVYVLGLFSSPLGAPKVPLRTPVYTYWGSFLLLKGLQRCHFAPLRMTIFYLAWARI